MQIRCYSCHIPITISRQNVNQALNIIHEDDLVYFDFRCSKCKKANRVSKEQLMHAAPGWEYESTETAKEKPKTKSKTKK